MLIVLIGGLHDEHQRYEKLLKQDTTVTHSFQATDSGREGLALFKQHPDCVLLDFCIFDMDGIDLIEKLRKKQDGTKVPILLLCEDGTEELTKEALEAGAHNYIFKSKITAEGLKLAISDTIENAAIPREERKITVKSPKDKKAESANDDASTKKETVKAKKSPPTDNEASKTTEADTPVTLSEKEIAQKTAQSSAGKTDDVTKLPDQSLFKQSLEQAISRAKRYSRNLSLLIIDLHNISEIKSTLSEEVGNLLLQAIAERLQEGIRITDSLARVGVLGLGEFALLLDEIRDHNDAGIVSMRLRKSLSTPLEVDGKEVTIEANIGIASFPGDADSLLDFHNAAVLAMYCARDREDGPDRNVVFADPEMNEQYQRQVSINDVIQERFEAKEFNVTYQPIFHLRDNEIYAYEAVTMWKSQDFGEVSPTEFTIAAEETGAIKEISEWLFSETISTYEAWSKSDVAPEKLFLKLSSTLTYAKDTLSKLKEIINTHKIPKNAIVFELSESLFSGNTASIQSIIAQLRSFGFLICISDFGSGYFSLNLLKGKVVDLVKIDKQLIAGMAENKKDAVIVSALISLANQLEIGVISDEANDLDQLRVLQQFGCDLAQSSTQAPAMTADQIANQIRIDKKLFVEKRKQL